MTTTAEKLRGQILFPCCPKQKTMAFVSSHGRASIKCPNCGKFATFDFDRMVAYPSPAARGASNQFKNQARID